MFKIDENYSDYYMNDPEKYPGGGAVNSSGPDSVDGTPWLAKIFNNCIGWMQALYIKAFGSLTGISNEAENAQTSDVVRALDKIQTDNNTAQRTISDGKYLPMEGSASSAKKLTTARKVYVKLGTASTSETKDFSGDTAIPVDGVLNVANGGTGSSTAAGARTNLGLGSAAVKTAGSAAGNVPEVGTALGTTNNNIVVTDASGKLKPSGTIIGSAAGKTAGSAAGNVPEVGTALGTTNNNIVVTDASGKLKPSGTTIGSAAGKTAGSAAGNVPLNGSVLQAGYKIVTTGYEDSNLRTSALVVEDLIKNGNLSFICQTAKNSAAKVANIIGTTTFSASLIQKGFTCRVMFENGNSAANPTLAVGNTSAKPIRVVRSGSLVTPTNKTGYWRGATAKSSEMWQPYTILDLMYDGTYWVIIGNPVVESHASLPSESISVSFPKGYTVYADGKTEQWSEIASSESSPVNLLVEYASGGTYIVEVTAVDGSTTVANIIQRTASAFTVKYSYASTTSFTRTGLWHAIGY